MYMNSFLAVSIGLVLALLQANTGGVHSQCIDGDIRYDPVNVSVIQVCLDDEWGYVCGAANAFSTEDVAVACNQLGNKSDDNSFVSAKFSSPLTDSSNEQYAALRSFYCTGLESRLVDCPIHSAYSTSQACKRNDDYYYYGAVDCTSEEIECINGEIREGDEGVIEVCSNGEFRLICGTTDGWNDKDAETACRELGHNPHGAKSIFIAAPVDSDSPYPVRFHCTGDEDTLADCPRQLMTKCDVTTVAVLKCGVQLKSPTITKIFSNEDFSQLTITWNNELQSEYNQYKVSCTSSDQSQTITFQAMTTSSNFTFTGIPSNNWYNCCVAIVTDEGVESVGSCEDYFVPVNRETSSCTITVASTTSSSTSVRFTDTPTSRTTAQQVIEEYGPWGYGFIIGLVLGVMVTMAICGCCMAVCLRRTKQQYRKTQNDIIGTDFVSVNANANSRSTNPLYNMTSSGSSYSDSMKYNQSTTSNKSLDNEYDYTRISARPLPSVPQADDQITPYLTTTAA